MNFKKYKAQLPITLWFLLTSIVGFGQDHPVFHAKKQIDIFQRFDNFTTKDGLPSNYIFRIFQDSDGFIWFATDNGLSRYDGFSFLNFLPIVGDSTSISNEYITSIAQDKEGFIWVGTKDGLNRLNPRTGIFNRFYKDKTPFLRDSWIRALLVCSDGYLWIDGSSGTTTRLETQNFDYLQFSRAVQASLDYPQHLLCESKKNKIISGGHSIPLAIIDKSNNSITIPKDTSINGWILNPAADMLEDIYGYTWFANTNGKLSIISLAEKKYYPINGISSIYSLCSDKKGSIWFGGYSGGAIRFDYSTNTITLFKNNPNNSNSISGNNTNDIFCDKSGCIWFATDNGLSRLSNYKYKFPIYKHISETESPPSNKIKSVFQDSDGDVWYGTQDAGIFSHKHNDNSFNKYSHNANDPSTVGSRHVTAITQDKQGIIWITLWNGKNGAINSFNKKSGKFQWYSTLDDYYWYSDIEINSLNEIIVGSWGSGLFYFDRKISDFSKTYLSNFHGFPTEISNPFQIVCDKNGSLWYGGLYNNTCYFSKKDSFINFASNNIPNKLTRFRVEQSKARRVIFIYKYGGNHHFTDTNGNLWSINENQLYEYLYQKDDFKLYEINAKINPKTICNKFDGSGFWIGGINQLFSFSFTYKIVTEIKLTSSIGNINHIIEASKNHLVIFSSTGIFNGMLSEGGEYVETKRISEIPIVASCLLSNGSYLLGGDRGLFILQEDLQTLIKVEGKGIESLILSIIKASNDNIYIGTDNGLVLYQEEKGVIKHWASNPTVKGGLASGKIFSIAQTPDGTFWLATDKCISKLNSDNETFTNFLESSNKELTSSLISAIYTDSKGFLWVGETSNRGLNRVNTKNGYIDHYLNIPWDSTSLRKGDINDIFENSNGEIWIGSTSGLSKFNSEKKGFVHYDSQNGFESDAVMAIREDKNANLWVSTTNGVSCFNPKTLECNTYTWMDGLQEGEFSRGCVTRLKDGKLVFGGLGGYNIFNPDSIKHNPNIPNPLISSVKINGQIKYFTNPEEINLTFSQRNIEFTFSSSDYHFPEKNKIEYKLEGFENVFIKSGENHLATYTNLFPGTYRFIVKVSNNDNLWCEKPIIVNIRVGFPFWFRWWSILLELAMLSGLITLIIKGRLKKIKEQKNDLEKEVALRTSQLLSQNEEILVQQDVLNKQKEHIHKIHNQLTDSLEYAKYLHSAYHLTKEQRDEILGENFLMSVPKEKLGGDFFWATKNDNKIIFAIVDCTGHGVPGALMSMVNLAYIKNVMLSSYNTEPNKALKELHDSICSTFSGGSRETTMLNTIDIGYCVLDRKENTIQFSGGHIDLYISSMVNGEKVITEIKSDKKRIGNPTQNDNFQINEIRVKKGDFIYMFSDGLTDQYNFEKKEKFSKNRVIKLLEYISTYPIEIQEEFILSKFYEWKGFTDQTDDITIIGIMI